MEPNQNGDPWEQHGIESRTGQPGVPDWTMLSPFGVVAFGAGSQPVERLLALQGAIARGVDFITSTPWPAISAAGITALTLGRRFAGRCLGASPSKPFTGQHP
jgi:hypothetical protein